MWTVSANQEVSMISVIRFGILYMPLCEGQGHSNLYSLIYIKQHLSQIIKVIY